MVRADRTREKTGRGYVGMGMAEKEYIMKDLVGHLKDLSCSYEIRNDRRDHSRKGGISTCLK